MNNEKSYTGIDYFRFISSLLIIAIHTSPLASISATGDFALTRIIARVAVPFFLMTSGFFLISKYTYNSDKLRHFIKKTCLIYAGAIIIYIPINVYNGYFKMDNILPNLIKDFLFDGTLYHLWYLPASAIGATISWYLVKKLNYRKAFIISILLYIVGLFGDSYYNIIQSGSVIDGFYSLIFQISDYTRNGIFFAPIFMILGGWIADNRPKNIVKRSVCGLAVSFILMLIEAEVLHFFEIQRHDSMYIFLLPVMYYLFNFILQFRGRRLEFLRTISLIIYIIHPLIIVVVRMVSKILHLQSIFVENSIVNYLVVCLFSILFSVQVVVLYNKNKLNRKREYIYNTDRAYLEVNLKNLEHNVKVLKKAMPPKCKLMAVVKAEAYGHGSFEISTHLNRIGVRAFATATIDEAIKLRLYGIEGEILILGYTDISRAIELRKYNLIQTIIDFDYAKALNRQGVRLKVHVKINTGMNRLGIDYLDLHKIEKVFSMKNIDVCGIYTHLCCADKLSYNEITFTRQQIDNFYNMLNSLERKGISIPAVHIQSSYGLMNYPDLTCDYVRAGIALYGVKSFPNDDTVIEPDLRPVLSLKSKVVLIRHVSKGESVGYGRKFIAEHDSTIAILPVGYADGFPRSLSCGNGYVRINENIVPIIGYICMDQLAVDITDVQNVCVGDSAVLVGEEFSDYISAPYTAYNAGSISNELLCRMGCRLQIKYK